MTDTLPIPVTSHDVARIDYWADRVRTGLQRSVRAVIDAGIDLLQAKAELDHGDWLPMLEKAGIHPRNAQELMAVAQHPVLGNEDVLAQLPASLGALTALSRMDEDELAEALEAGAITPDLTVRDARDLVKEAAKALAGAASPDYDGDPDEGSTTDEPEKVATAPRFADLRDEVVFSIDRGRLADAVAVMGRPGFKLTVPVAQDLLRALRPLEQARSELLQLLEDEVGDMIELPVFSMPRRVIPVADTRDSRQVAGTAEFEAAQAPHASV